MENKQNFFKKILSIKHIEIYIALILIVLSIMLYFYLNNKTDSKEELTSNSISTQIEQILSKIEGVGECNVLITYANTYETSETSSTKEVQGVIVVCDGGDNLKVVEKITSAIKTLLNINSLNIKVFKSL